MSCTTAPFEAAYGAESGSATMPAKLPRFTMLPGVPSAIHRRAAICIVRKSAFTLRSIIRSKSVSV